MNAHDPFSLRITSNRALAGVMLLFVFAVGYFLGIPPDAYLAVGAFIGLAWGTLRTLGFGTKRWQNAAIIFSMVMLQSILQKHYLPQLQSFNDRMLLGLQFLGIALLLAMFVVWMKEREESGA